MMRKFGKTNKKRESFINGLARALVLNGKIKTTQARAKEIKRVVEKLITKGKTSSLANVRNLSVVIGLPAAQKITKEIAPQYINRPGGYLRLVNLPQRKGDGAKMAVIQFVK